MAEAQPPCPLVAPASRRPGAPWGERSGRAAGGELRPRGAPGPGVSPGGGRAAATASGTSPSGRPRGPAPSASPPCWTATHRVTHPTHAERRLPPRRSPVGASRPGRRAAKGDTVAHASRPTSLRGPPGCGWPCPAPARPPRELPSPRWARPRLPHVCPLGPSRGPPCACGRPAPEPGRSAKWPVSPARAQPCRGPWLPPPPTSPPSRPWARGALPAVNASDQWVPSQGSDRGLLAQPGGLNP